MKRCVKIFFAVFLLCSGFNLQAFAAMGSVLTVKQTQIEFFLGIDDGIYPDQELYILRHKKLLGKVKVTYVGEMTSWGEISSLETGVIPEPGDQISSSAPSEKNKPKTTTVKTATPTIPSTTAAVTTTPTLSETPVTPVKTTTVTVTPSSTSTTASTPSNPPASLQKQLLEKKELGKKGNVYLVIQNQAGITLGRKDGLKEGDEVVVFQGNEAAGKVKVKTLLEDYALCDMSPASGKTFKKGDVVIFNPNLVIDEKKKDETKPAEDKKEEKKEETKDEKKDAPPPSTP